MKNYKILLLTACLSTSVFGASETTQRADHGDVIKREILEAASAKALAELEAFKKLYNESLLRYKKFEAELRDAEAAQKLFLAKNSTLVNKIGELTQKISTNKSRISKIDILATSLDGILQVRSAALMEALQSFLSDETLQAEVLDLSRLPETLKNEELNAPVQNLVSILNAEIAEAKEIGVDFLSPTPSSPALKILKALRDQNTSELERLANDLVHIKNSLLKREDLLNKEFAGLNEVQNEFKALNAKSLAKTFEFNNVGAITRSLLAQRENALLAFRKTERERKAHVVRIHTYTSYWNDK